MRAGQLLSSLSSGFFKLISGASMAQAIVLAELPALLKGILDVTPYGRGVRVDIGAVRVSVFPAQGTRRADTATAARRKQISPRPSRPPPRGGISSAGRRKANRAAARAGLPLPFPPPAVTTAASGNRPAPGAAQASAAQADPVASTPSARPAASYAAAVAAAPASAPPSAAAQQLVRRSPASSSDAHTSSDDAMQPASVTGAAAKQRTPPQSTTAPPPPSTTAPSLSSLPPSRDHGRGGNAAKRVAAPPAPSPTHGPTHLASDDLRLRLQQRQHMLVAPAAPAIAAPAR